MIYTNDPIVPERAKGLLALPLEDKIVTSWEKIDQWYTAWGGQCYVSFSGGKDSTVLAYLAARYLASFRTPPWPLNLVFVNTGLEYPEIQRFVNEYANWLRKEFPHVTINLVRLRPKMNITQVVNKYGYSIVSKEVANCVWLARKSKNGTRMARLRGELLDKDGNKSAYCCDNWAFLLDAPFLISSECCRIMKKSTAHAYESKAREKPMVATMAAEGRQRMQKWMATGCNAFEGKRPMGKPMSFWTEQDVLHFLVERQIPYCSVYGDIVASDGENDYDTTLVDCPLHCTGCQRTGCLPCAFGAHLEKGVNRFQRMKETHPKHYRFCIEGGAIRHFRRIVEAHEGWAGLCTGAGLHWSGILKGGSMTQKEIVTALRICSNAKITCNGCPLDGSDDGLNVGTNCFDFVARQAADLIENQQREIEALKSALHEMAVDFVAMGRIDYWFCDDVPTELHMKYQPKNDGNYENEPCVECVKEYYLKKANDNPSVTFGATSPYTGEARAVEDASPYAVTTDSSDGDEICRAALEAFGKSSQMQVAIEEMSELTKELCKNGRGQENTTHIAEKIADVEIMLQQMVMLFDCAGQVDKFRRYKLERLAEMIKEKKHD